MLIKDIYRGSQQIIKIYKSGAIIWDRVWECPTLENNTLTITQAREASVTGDTLYIE